MPAETARPELAELLAAARIAVLDLAPAQTPPHSQEVPSLRAWQRASSAIAELLKVLEVGEDSLRALMGVDMALAIEHAASAERHNRGQLVSLLVQALSVLGDDAPRHHIDGNLPSRSPLALANELRALRGAPLLSGNIIFAIAVDARIASVDDDAPAKPDPRLASSARRLRSYYQQGLIAWLGHPNSAKAAADRIGEVFARLQVFSQGGAQETLWRAAASFARLLEDPRWRVSAAVKRLLGQLDGQLKRLCDSGESTPEVAPGLVPDLLFYVGEGRDVEATIGLFPSRSALLAAFVAPLPNQAEQPTAVLSLLNELLSISGELMEALAPDMSWLAKRGWLSERMLQVADGLGLLGVHRLRHRVLDEIELLRATPGSGDPPTGGWGPMAERLHVLGAELLTAAGLEPAAAVAENTAGMPSSGHIARRLEADLMHAERLIERLEQGRTSALPEEGPAEDAGEDAGEDADAASGWRHRLEELTGAVRADDTHMQAHIAAGDPPVSRQDDVPAVAVDHALLDDVGLLAGDIDASRARLEQQVGALLEGLQDMDGGIRALREELDGLRLHAEALRMPRDFADSPAISPGAGDAAALAEIRERLERLASGLTALAEMRDGIEGITGDSRSVLVHQARDNVALEQRLMHFRMLPLDAQLDDLGNTLAERAAKGGKQVMLRLDAGALRIEPEKMAGLVPILRSLTESMIEQGVEPPRARVLAGHPPGCVMDMRFRRRGADLDMLFSADCAAPAEAVVAASRHRLRLLGGCLNLEKEGRFATRMSLQMPLAPRIATVLLVAVAGEIVALPLTEVAAVLQLPVDELQADDKPSLEHDGVSWPLGTMRDLLAFADGEDPDAERSPPARQPLVLMESGHRRGALLVDAIGERVDVVVRSVAPQLRTLSGLAGAAILGDGQVVLLLDVGQLMESRARDRAADLETVV